MSVFAIYLVFCRHTIFTHAHAPADFNGIVQFNFLRIMQIKAAKLERETPEYRLDCHTLVLKLKTFSLSTAKSRAYLNETKRTKKKEITNDPHSLHSIPFDSIQVAFVVLLLLFLSSLVHIHTLLITN